MKKILTLSLIVLGFTSFAQKTQFQRLIGGSKGENAYSVDKSREGGYYLAGSTSSVGAGDKDAYLVKTDGLGKVLWARAYGESKDDVAWKVKTTGDSGCVIVGTTSSFNSNNKDAFITKVTKSGAISWTTTLSTDSVEDAYNVAIARNGDYLVCGFIANDTNANDMLVFRVKTDGSISWVRKLGSAGNDEAFAIAEDLKGDIVVCGVTTYDSVTVGGKNGSPGDKDIVVASLDDKGGLNWMRTYGTFEKEEAWDIKVDGNNRYIIAAWGVAAGGISNDIYLMSTDTNGTINWVNSYGTIGDDRAFNVAVMPGNNYQVVGYADPNGTDRDVAVLSVNGAGRLTGSQLLGDADKDGHWPTDIVRTPDGGIAVLSTSNSFNSSNGDNFYLIRGSDKADFNCNSRFEMFQESSASFTGVTLKESTQGHKAVSRTFKTNTSSPSFDSTLCCKLAAEVAADSMVICKGEKRNIGGPKIEGYSYSWTDNVSGFKSSDANPQVAPTQTTTYKLVVSSKDSKCASDSATIRIRVKDVLNDDFVQDTMFCSGDSVIMKIRSDLSSYSWIGTHVKSTDSTIKVKKGDTLYVELFDNNGCGYLDTAIAEELALPVVNIGNDTTICDNTVLTLTGPPNMKSYLWTPGPSSGRTYDVSTDNTYKLVVEDNNGCVNQDEIKVLTNPHSTFDLGVDTSFCQGGSYTILGPGALSGYIWNDTASSLQNLRVRQGGTYHLTAFNSFGCAYSDTVVVSEWSLPTFSLGSDINLCQGTSKVLTGPSGMQTYLWNSGKNTQNDTIKKGGQVFLIVSDDNGCQASDTVEVTEKQNPIPDLGQDTTICDTITLTIGTARPYAAYEWSTGATTRTIDVKDEDDYTVTVTDNFGCKGTATKRVDTMDCGTGSILRILSAEVSIYPNPNQGILQLDIKEYQSSNGVEVSLMDINGRVLLQRSYEAKTSISDTYDINSLPSGVYIVRISNQIGYKQLRLMVE